MTTTDLPIIRDLARRVAEVAALPEMETRRREWYRHNALQPGKALIYCSPEGSWLEIQRQPEFALQCTDETARAWEMDFRTRLYVGEHFSDDQVLDNRLSVGHVLERTGYGMEPVQHRTADTARGSYVWDAPLQDPADLSKLRVPTTTVDWDASRARLAEVQEVFDGILDVQLRSFHWWTASTLYAFAGLRGLEQIMLDMVERPAWLHEAMAWLRDAMLQWLDSLEAQGLLSLNNGNDYIGSGAFGFSEELPAPGYDGSHVRLRDLWGFTENQETTAISPRMFNEFILQYQKPVQERFGLNCFGCCEPLHDRFDYVLTIPRLRRISISPWCDRRISAERLGGDYIFSWKPNPARLAMEGFDEDLVRRETRETLEIARDCRVEIILKDTHTCRNEPDRFDRWCRIAREEVERAAS
jgi:hypothetical protein